MFLKCVVRKVEFGRRVYGSYLMGKPNKVRIRNFTICTDLYRSAGEFLDWFAKQMQKYNSCGDGQYVLFQPDGRRVWGRSEFVCVGTIQVKGNKAAFIDKRHGRRFTRRIERLFGDRQREKREKLIASLERVGIVIK